MVRRGAVSLRLEPALAQRLSARRAAGRSLRLAAAARAPRDLGLQRRDDARDDGLAAGRRTRAALASARRKSDRPQVRVLHCPVNTAGIPWANSQALRRRGVES